MFYRDQYEDKPKSYCIKISLGTHRKGRAFLQAAQIILKWLP